MSDIFDNGVDFVVTTAVELALVMIGMPTFAVKVKLVFVVIIFGNRILAAIIEVSGEIFVFGVLSGSVFKGRDSLEINVVELIVSA